MEKIKYQLNIGGGFQAQPEHKPKVIPVDYLARFCNVNSDNLGSIVTFANNYGFSPYIIPDQEHSIIEKFKIIHTKYAPIIGRLIMSDVINYADILQVNKDLEGTCPSISIRNGAYDPWLLEESFAIYVLESDTKELPIVEITHNGSFDKELVTADTHISVKMHIPKGSKSNWSYRRIKDGVTKIPEIIPSEKWETDSQNLRAITLHGGHVNVGKNQNPLSLEMILKLGKTDFKREDLTATWSPTSGESFIAKRIWDHLNSEFKGQEYKQCKVCGDYHQGRSNDYCTKKGCRAEWDSRRHSIKKK